MAGYVMGRFINCKATWADRSSGVEDETGQEIEIYTDSPSFRPDVPVDYSAAPHPWMKLLPIAAGVSEANFRLELPCTFITFRVRQYNANGPGDWSAVAGTTFPIAPPAGTSVPPPPINPGFTITTPTDTPPDPNPIPGDPPPDPIPTNDPPTGTTSNYVFTTQFSGVQGQNQWSYRDSSGANLTYSAADSVWRGDETYLAIWNGGFHHGATGAHKSPVLRFTVPEGGNAVITGTAYEYAAGAGAKFQIKHNGSTIFDSGTMTPLTNYPYDKAITVSLGDTIDFYLVEVTAAVNNNTQLNPTIALTTDGTTPTNPVMSSLAPDPFSVTTGGQVALTATISRNAPSALTLTVDSSDDAKITVPATIVIPAGLSSVQFSAVGAAVGSSTITVAYDGTSKTAVGTVFSPPTGSWANAPLSGTVLLDYPFTAVVPGSNPPRIAAAARMQDVFNSCLSADDATAPTSPSKCCKTRIEAFAGQGGGQLDYTLPRAYRRVFCGMMWRTNPQFQGRIVANKVWFLRNFAGANGYWGFTGGPRQGQSAFYYMFGPNSAILNNAHLFNGDPVGTAYPNTANSAVVQMGVWYKLESEILCSTTTTSRDGTMRLWINGALVLNYSNLNYCGANGEGIDTWSFNATWDGNQDMGQSNTVAWEHWLDHLYIVGRDN